MPFVAISLIQTRTQIRDVVLDTALETMAKTIKEKGLLQPIRCRIENGVYIVVDGERRLQACKLAGLTEVEIHLDEKVKLPSEILQQQYIANTQREDLSAIEKAKAVQAYMDATKCNAQQAGSELGMSPAAVTKLLAILSLSTEHQDFVASGELSASDAYELSMVTDPVEREELARKLVDGTIDRHRAASNRRLKLREKKNAGDPTLKRASAFLGNGRFVTVSGGDLTIDSFIASLEELLTKAKRSRTQGVTLPTLIKLLKDQSSAS